MTLGSGDNPTVGNSFQVMTFTSAAGSFSSTSGLQVGHNVELDPAPPRPP